MAKTKLVNGVRVNMTNDEETAFDAEQAANKRAIDAEIAAESALAYRRARKAAYVDQIGTEKDYDETVGDVLDTLIEEIKALSGTRTSAFTAMVNKNTTIKSDNPKP